MATINKCKYKQWKKKQKSGDQNSDAMKIF